MMKNNNNSDKYTCTLRICLENSMEMILLFLTERLIRVARVELRGIQTLDTSKRLVLNNFNLNLYYLGTYLQLFH